MPLTKGYVLRELPTRMYRGEEVVLKDFQDIKRIVEAYRFTDKDLDFFLREVRARKEVLGYE